MVEKAAPNVGCPIIGSRCRLSGIGSRCGLSRYRLQVGIGAGYRLQVWVPGVGSLDAVSRYGPQVWAVQVWAAEGFRCGLPRYGLSRCGLQV